MQSLLRFQPTMDPTYASFAENHHWWVMVVPSLSEGLTTPLLGVRRFKSEKGKKFGFSRIFWIFWDFFEIFGFFGLFLDFFFQFLRIFSLFRGFWIFFRPNFLDFLDFFWIFWIFFGFFLGCTKTFLSGQPLVKNILYIELILN